MTPRRWSAFDIVNKEEALRGNTEWWKGEARAQRSGESNQAYRNYGEMRYTMDRHIKNFDDPAYKSRLEDPKYRRESVFAGKAPDETRLSRFNQFMFSNPNNPNNPNYVGPMKGFKGSEDYKGRDYRSEDVAGFDFQWSRGEGGTLERVDNPWTPDINFEPSSGPWNQYILSEVTPPPPPPEGYTHRPNDVAIRPRPEAVESVQKEGRDLTAGGIAKPMETTKKTPDRVGRGPDPRRIRIPQKARGVKRRGKQTLLGGYA